jgi:hypothetical protein
VSLVCTIEEDGNFDDVNNHPMAEVLSPKAKCTRVGQLRPRFPAKR